MIGQLWVVIVMSKYRDLLPAGLISWPVWTNVAKHVRRIDAKRF